MNENIFYMLEADISRIKKNYRNSNKFKKSFLMFSCFIIYSEFRAILLYRITHKFKDNKYIYLLFEFLKRILSPIEIDTNAIIGPGIHFPHPRCIVVGACTIGSNVSIYQGVTIGIRRGNDDYANIGDNVTLYAGSKILGNVLIGNNSKIGANAVVIEDVPPNSVAVGIPAYYKQIG